MLDQSIIDNMNLGSLDENLFELSEMAYVDKLIEEDEEAVHSLIAESTFFDNLDNFFNE